MAASGAASTLARLMRAYTRRNEVTRYSIEAEGEELCDVPASEDLDACAETLCDTAAALAAGAGRTVTVTAFAWRGDTKSRRWPVRVAPSDADSAAPASTADVVTAEALRHTRAMVALVLQQAQATTAAANAIIASASAQIADLARQSREERGLFVAYLAAERQRADDAVSATREARELAEEAVAEAERATRDLKSLRDNPLLNLVVPKLAAELKGLDLGALKAKAAAAAKAAPEPAPEPAPEAARPPIDAEAV